MTEDKQATIARLNDQFRTNPKGEIPGQINLSEGIQFLVDDDP